MENDDIIIVFNAKGHVFFIGDKGSLTITISSTLKEYKIPLSKILIKNDQIRGRNIKALGEDFGYTYFIGWDELKPLPYNKFKDIINEIITQVAMCDNNDIDDSHLRHIVFIVTHGILKDKS